MALDKSRFNSRSLKRARDRFATAVDDDRIDPDRFEKNNVAGDAMPYFCIRRIHKTTTIFHDEDLGAKTLDVRQRFEQCRRFGNDFFHRDSTVEAAVSAAHSEVLQATRLTPQALWIEFAS